MGKNHFLKRLLIASGVGSSLLWLNAQPLKVIDDRGHVSPLKATITFRSEKTRDVTIAGIGHPVHIYSHTFFVRTEAGVGRRALWLDQIASIYGLDKLRTTKSEFKIKLKDGSEIDALFVQANSGSGCRDMNELIEAELACSSVVIANGDESTERLDLRDLKAIQFLPHPRRDKLGNAMFDVWRYSPFTGEKLTQP